MYTNSFTQINSNITSINSNISDINNNLTDLYKNFVCEQYTIGTITTNTSAHITVINPINKTKSGYYPLSVDIHMGNNGLRTSLQYQSITRSVGRLYVDGIYAYNIVSTSTPADVLVDIVWIKAT